MCPPYCIVFSFRIPVVHILLAHNDTLLVLGVGIDLDWDYEKRELKLAMKGYARRALQQFQHPTPTKYNYGPTKYVPPEYGKKIQHSTQDTSP